GVALRVFGALGSARLARMPVYVPMLTSVSRRQYHRNTRPRAAPASALAPMTMAAWAAAGPVGRSCAYGGRENPTAVSQPTPASRTAATGSAANDTTPATTAQAISTPVAG